MLRNFGDFMGAVAHNPARQHVTVFRTPPNRDVSPLVLMLDWAQVSIGARFLRRRLCTSAGRIRWKEGGLGGVAVRTAARTEGYTRTFCVKKSQS